jgi:hypothetical protein
VKSRSSHKEDFGISCVESSDPATRGIVTFVLCTCTNTSFCGSIIIFIFIRPLNVTQEHEPEVWTKFQCF